MTTVVNLIKYICCDVKYYVEAKLSLAISLKNFHYSMAAITFFST
jgi:hypothetical protein